MKRQMRASLRALLATIILLLISIIALFAFVITDWGYVSGTKVAGTPTSDGRVVVPPQTHEFRKITLIGHWHMELTQGQDRQMEIACPTSCSPWLRWEIKEGQLELEFDPPDLASSFAIASITLAELEQLDLRGHNRVRLQSFQGDRLTLVTEGNNQIEGVSGSYTTLNLSTTGMNHINLNNTRFQDADVRIQGLNHVTLLMDGGLLSGSMAGAGTLDYVGSVSAETVRIAGPALVRRRD